MNSKLLLLLVVFTQIALSSLAQGKKWWTRAIIGDAIPDGKDKRLELQGVTQESVHLIGELSLNQQRAGGTVPPLMIQGHLDRSGMFSPNVAFDVSNEETENWKSIESSLSDKIEVTLTTAANIRSLCILVQLDAFQPYIDKYRFGRVTLQTGETTVFSLLLLTEDRGKR
jgi:hypothetical protein